MPNFYSLLASLGLLLTLLAAPATAQNLRNDGFQRRNGQMHVLRNGQLRPMTRDARLPTGAVVTKDGFIRAANGTRTELREGLGCDLKGNVVVVGSAASGGLVLGAPTGAQRRVAAATPAAGRVALKELFGAAHPRDEDGRDEEDEPYEYDKKQAEQAREQRKKEEEWAREARQRYEEQSRERGKKWKEKRKKGKDWDD